MLSLAFALTLGGNGVNSTRYDAETPRVSEMIPHTEEQVTGRNPASTKQCGRSVCSTFREHLARNARGFVDQDL